MGSDHSQIEIYHESKHGVLFNAQHRLFNLDARPEELTTADMPVPTCATCHMSGLEGMNVTHHVTERLSWYLFASVSERRLDDQGGPGDPGRFRSAAPAPTRGRADLIRVTLTRRTPAGQTP